MLEVDGPAVLDLDGVLLVLALVGEPYLEVLAVGALQVDVLVGHARLESIATLPVKESQLLSNLGIESPQIGELGLTLGKLGDEVDLTVALVPALDLLPSLHFPLFVSTGEVDIEEAARG